MNNLLIKLILTIYLVMAFFVLSACNQIPDDLINDPQLVSISVDTTTLEAQYTLDEFDLTSVELILTKDDGSIQRINVTMEMINALDFQKLSIVGQHTITISYQGHNTTFVVNLMDADSDTLLMGLYLLGVSGGFIQETYEDWLSSIKGEDGVSIENAYVNEDGELILALSDNSVVNAGIVVGAKGEDGESVEFRVINDHLEWRYISSETWVSLLDLSSVHGMDGLSAYELYSKYHPNYSGTEEDWILEYFGTLKEAVEKPYGIFLPRVLSRTPIEEGTLITLVGTLRHTQFASGKGGAFIYHNYFSIEDTGIGLEINIEGDAYSALLMNYLDEAVRIDVYYYENGSEIYGVFAGSENAIKLDNGAYELLRSAENMTKHVLFRGRTSLQLLTMENQAGFIGNWQSQNTNVYDHNGIFINHPLVSGNVTFKGVLEIDDYQREIVFTVETYKVTKLSDLDNVAEFEKVLIQGYAYNRIHSTSSTFYTTSVFIYDQTGYAHVFHSSLSLYNHISIATDSEVEVLVTKNNHGFVGDFITGVTLTTPIHHITRLEDTFEAPEVVGPMTVSELKDSSLTSGTPIIITGTYFQYFYFEGDELIIFYRIGNWDENVYINVHHNNYDTLPEAKDKMIKIEGIYFKESHSILLTNDITIIEDDTANNDETIPTEDVEGEDIILIPRYPNSVRVAYTYYTDYRIETYDIEYLSEDTHNNVINYYTNHFQTMEWSIQESTFIIDEMYVITATLAEYSVVMYITIDVFYTNVIKISINFQNDEVIPQ